MTFHEVNTRLDQPMEHDIHRGRLGRVEYYVPWVDQSLYSPKLKVINCFIILYFTFLFSLFVFVSAAGQYSSLLHTLILRTNETLELIPHDLVLF